MSSSDTPIGLASDEALEAELRQRSEGRRLEDQRKRMAAYAAAEEQMLAGLRAQFPGLSDDNFYTIYDAYRTFHENWG